MNKQFRMKMIRNVVSYLVLFLLLPSVLAIVDYQNITTYSWCSGNSLIQTNSSQDVDDYFTKTYQCTTIDKCSSNVDCADDKVCEVSTCTLLECASNQIIRNHACVTLECTSNANCIKQIDLDCDGVLDGDQGTCGVDNRCSYIAREECPQYLILWNKYTYWIIAGAVLLTIGIAVLYRKYKK